jgi:acetyl-CoA carboxylase biotin carboxyl carrier protein
MARVEEEEGSEQIFLVRSPAVGIVDEVPDRGSYISPSNGFLTLRILGQSHSLYLPREVRGWVQERMIESTSVPVEFNQPLLRLSPGQAPDAGGDGSADLRSSRAEALEEGLVAVRSSSQGVFYRAANPGSPPYVDEGSGVSEGTVMGLVEVMKCFYQITYGGPGLPEKGTVERILVENTVEVESGQALFLIRPDE